MRMGESEKFAKLTIGTKEYQLPIYKASIGPSVIDVRALYKTTGCFTYDPGYLSTASCESKITYIDGDKGVLQHCGYDIKDLAKNNSFLEVSYLLLNQKMPERNEFAEFCKEIMHHSLVNEQIRNIFGAFRPSAHPMAIILSVFGALSAFYHDNIDMASSEGRYRSAIKVLAKMPTIAAMAYKYMISQAFIYPDEELSFTENFLKMMFARPSSKYTPNPVLVKALDKIFILHADHEQNASTSTMRSAGSSGPNPFACVSAAISSLWGPAHGGANEAVIRMLEKIGDVSNIPRYIEMAKDKDNPFRLMGFGHRVYKNYDPRASVLRESCHEVLAELGQQNDPLLKVALELERIALSDEYFVTRKLFPNVDFYSGIIYKAMNIPPNMFTVLFAVARCSGWVAQWQEMWNDQEFKICRPRQLYTGQVGRDK